MYQQNDYVVFKEYGICQVINIGIIKNSIADPKQLYYTLKSVFGLETIYTPTNTTSFLRAAMNKKQAQELIDRIPLIPQVVIENRNLGLLKREYEQLFATHDLADLISLLKCLNYKNQEAIKSKKKLGQLDQLYMKKAEVLLHSELAVALEVELDTMIAFIKKAVVS